MRPISLSGPLRQAIAADLEHLAGPGTTLTGSERVAVAAAARQGPPGDDVDAVAARVYAEPATIRRPWVEDAGAELGWPRYIEVVAIAARLSAVDTVHRALGHEVPALPRPIDGEPTGAIDPEARVRSAWVPTSGGASIVFALSLVPTEMAAQRSIHGPLYLTYEGMDEIDYVGDLTRAQMELLAARTSFLNECFY